MNARPVEPHDHSLINNAKPELQKYQEIKKSTGDKYKNEIDF